MIKTMKSGCGSQAANTSKTETAGGKCGGNCSCKKEDQGYVQAVKCNKCGRLFEIGKGKYYEFSGDVVDQSGVKVLLKGLTCGSCVMKTLAISHPLTRSTTNKPQEAVNSSPA